jgi:hypothetical protein
MRYAVMHHLHRAGAEFFLWLDVLTERDGDIMPVT